MEINFDHQNSMSKIKMKMIFLLSYFVNLWNLRAENRGEIRVNHSSCSEDVGIFLAGKNLSLDERSVFKVIFYIKAGRPI